MCVPASLGRGGVERIVEIELCAEEQAQLLSSAHRVKEQIACLL
jgi:malate/lactate dehydrogenase